MADERTARIGDNQPPPFEALSLEIEKYLEGARVVAKEHPTIQDAAIAEKMDGFLLQLGKFEKRRKEGHAEEKAPVLQQGREIDAKWKKLADIIEVARGFIAPKVLAWKQALKAKQDAEIAEAKRIEDEKRRKADEDRRIADELKRKAEAGELAKGEDPVEAELRARQSAEQAKDAKSEVSATKREHDEAKPRFASGGRTRSVSTVKTYSAQITDWKIAALRYRNNEWVKEAIQRAANLEVKTAMAGGQSEPMIPGVEIITTESVRT